MAWIFVMIVGAAMILLGQTGAIKYLGIIIALVSTIIAIYSGPQESPSR